MISESLETALAAVTVEPCDQATVELARMYADLIDNEGDVIKVGPLLLTALTALRMTPAARAAVAQGGAQSGQPSELDKLRKRRAARQHHTQAAD